MVAPAGWCGLGSVALGYLLLDFALEHLQWLPAAAAAYLRAAVWALLAAGTLSRVFVYRRWPQEARCTPAFLLAVLFLVGSLVGEAVFGVHFVTAVMGLDWHRKQQPLPDLGQWLFLALDERLPPVLTVPLRAPLVGLHHFLVVFVMLCFSALWGCTSAPGMQIGARYMRAMAWGRLLRTLVFVGTILPSPRPWCAPHRFQVPDHPSPWAARYHLPYAHDSWALWALLKDHTSAAPFPNSAHDSEFVPDWGRLQFLAPFLRPTAATSGGWFSTLARAGGGCNDLVFSGHMLVATLTAMAFQEMYPGWTSRVLWLLVVHSGMREVRERHHYSADVVLGVFVGVMLWRATRSGRERDARREDELWKAAKDADIDKVRQLLARNRPPDQEAESLDWRTLATGVGIVVGTSALCLVLLILCKNG